MDDDRRDLPAVNPRGTDVEALLANAVKKVVSTGVADADGELERAFEQVAA